MNELTLTPQNKNPSLFAPTLRIQQNGYIVINKMAFEGLGCPERVKLDFDVERRVLVLSKAATVRNSYKVVSQTGAKKFTPGRICGARFCNANNIERGQKYEAKLVNGYLIVQLPKAKGDEKISNPITVSWSSPASKGDSWE